MVYYLQSGLQQNTIKHLYGLMENVLDEEGNIIGQKEADDISKGYFIGHALDENGDISSWEYGRKTKLKKQPNTIRYLVTQNCWM